MQKKQHPNEKFIIQKKFFNTSQLHFAATNHFIQLHKFFSLSAMNNLNKSFCLPVDREEHQHTTTRNSDIETMPGEIIHLTFLFASTFLL